MMIHRLRAVAALLPVGYRGPSCEGPTAEELLYVLHRDKG
jgi:hypothetical protein